MNGIKETALMSSEQRKALVAVKDNLSVEKQCHLLDISRSTYYYKSQLVGDKDLAIMTALDKLYLEDPTRGTRRMCDE